MKRVLKILGSVVVVLVVALGAAYLWASSKSARLLARSVETHTAEFPVPFPLSGEEQAELGLGDQEAEALALERAVERGRHLIEARYGCAECHGSDFGGGVMMDAPPVARLYGPNLTEGQGSRTMGFRPADWDRIVRHGVRADGRPAAMPSEDFQLMSDQELSDIVAYIRAQPAVDNETMPVTLGPVGKVLMATGKLRLSADVIGDHDGPHAETPPTAEVSVEFGRHLAGVCTGCHGQDLTGGPIPGGDPSWAPARNLTPHEDALGPWTYEQFVTALREGQRPDGTELLAPMTLVVPAAQNMTDTELEAIWTYLRSLPPRATGG